jgi:hypothetical protein
LKAVFPGMAQVMRHIVFLGLCSVAALCLAVSAKPAPRAAADCTRPDSLSSSWEAVFGHSASRTEADSLQKRAAAVNFKSAIVETDGCGDYETEVPGGAGLDTAAQRQGFRIEARQVGFSVSFEAPCCYTATTIGHGWFANFGQRPTLESATLLEFRALGVRFNHLEIERTGPSAYLVLLPAPTGFSTSAGRTSFAAEARNSSAHLAVSFVRR